MASPRAQAIRTLHQQWCGLFDAPGADAEAILRRTFQDCRQALESLQSELLALNYPVESMLFASTSLPQRIARLEQALGAPIPLSLACFWQEVGGVSLVSLGDYLHLDFWQEQGLADACCDGLYIEALHADAEDYFLSEWEDFQDSPEEFYLPLSPDAHHKDDVSGGASYGLRVQRGQSDVLTPWLGYEGSAAEQDWGQAFDFVGYLRWSLLVHAGFPGFAAEAAFAPIRDRLLSRVEVF
ncbi:MAG: hypothetical protein JO200_06975 [Comamonas sp.]|nr:hypothetical protein [Comamonas sp.]